MIRKHGLWQWYYWLDQQVSLDLAVVKIMPVVHGKSLRLCYLPALISTYLFCEPYLPVRHSLFFHFIFLYSFATDHYLRKTMLPYFLYQFRYLFCRGIHLYWVLPTPSPLSIHPHHHLTSSPKARFSRHFPHTTTEQHIIFSNTETTSWLQRITLNRVIKRKRYETKNIMTSSRSSIFFNLNRVNRKPSEGERDRVERTIKKSSR